MKVINLRRGQYYFIIYTCPRNSGPPTFFIDNYLFLKLTNTSFKEVTIISRPVLVAVPTSESFVMDYDSMNWKLTKQQLAHAV